MRRILSLGECNVPPRHYIAALNALHEAQPIGELLFAQGGNTQAQISIWARDERSVPLIAPRLEGSGLARLQAALDAAAYLYPLPEVIIWGDVRRFVNGRRECRGDVPQAAVVAEVQRYGLQGWRWADGRLVRPYLIC